MTAKAKSKTRALTVRKLPADHYDWLREQAAANGRSMEGEMRAIVANAKLASSGWPDSAEPKLRGFAESSSKKGQGKPGRKPAPKISAEEAVARLQALFAKATKGRKSKKLLSEEFMEERRRMWGEE